jgi:hypothetical protein
VKLALWETFNSSYARCSFDFQHHTQQVLLDDQRDDELRLPEYVFFIRCLSSLFEVTNLVPDARPAATRKHLYDIYEYARMRGLRHVFDVFPPDASYVVEHVPPEFSIRNGQAAFLPKRIQIGKNDQCQVWAYLRLQGGARTGGTELRLYAETATSLLEIGPLTVHEFPFAAPLSFFATSGTSYTSGRQLRYLIKYIFLKLGLVDDISVGDASNAAEMIAGALRKIRDYYDVPAGKYESCFREQLLIYRQRLSTVHHPQ